MVVSVLRAAGFAFATLLMLAIIASQFPSMRASLEEERIFNAENADLFGEDPFFYTQIELLKMGEDTSGGFVRMSIDGDEREIRAGDVILRPCLSLSKLLDKAVLLDHCGSYALLSLAEQSAASINLRVLNTSSVPLLEQGPRIIDLRGDAAIQALVSDYRRRLYDRPLSLLGEIDVKTLTREGKREYYLSPGRDKKVFTTLGLKSGDRVRAFDGVDLSSGDAPTEMYERLDEAEHVALTLERNGEDWVVLLDFGGGDAEF